MKNVANTPQILTQTHFQLYDLKAVTEPASISETPKLAVQFYALKSRKRVLRAEP